MAEWRYTGTILADAVVFFREKRAEMRTLRRVTVGVDGTTVKDINGNTMVLPGLVPGCSELDVLLKLAGASYNPSNVHDPIPEGGPSREYEVVRHDPWGHDRVL